MDVREKLVELANDVLRYLPWGEVQKHTAEQIADRMMDHGVTVQEWISVKDRLPESKTKVLVYGGNDLTWVNGVNRPMPSVYTGYMRGLDEGWFTWDEQKYIAKVTHWMPLPEPPKGEKA